MAKRMLDPEEWNDSESADYGITCFAGGVYADLQNEDARMAFIDAMYEAGNSPEAVDAILLAADALGGRWN